MKRTLVIFLITLSAEMILAVPRAICPNQTIEAGQSNISLTAYLDPPVDLSAYTVVWKRDDLNKDGVHAYRGKLDYLREQSAQYRGRTTLNHEDLCRGNLTLWLSSARPSDSGRYKVYIPKLRAGCITDLYVEDRQNDTTRNDSSPTRPPDDRDAANMEAVRNIVIPVVVVVVVGGLIVFLVKSGKIKTCKKKLEGMWSQEVEKTPTDCEMKNLKTTERDEDPPNPAHNGLNDQNRNQNKNRIKKNTIVLSFVP